MSKRCILGNGWRESWILTRSVSIFLWTTAAVSSFLTLGLALILLSFVMSFRTMQPLPRLFCRFILFAGGQRLMLKTPMPPVQHGPYLYMFNHASMLDTLIMIAIIPEYTMAIGKAEQFDVPIWGTLIKRWGRCRFTDRIFSGLSSSLTPFRMLFAKVILYSFLQRAPKSRWAFVGV